jgi:hypothetical protein
VSYGSAELVALKHEALLAGHERLERLPFLLLACLAPYRKSSHGGAPGAGPGQVAVAAGEGRGEERGGGKGRGHCVGNVQMWCLRTCWIQLDAAAISLRFGFRVARCYS